MSMHNYGSDVSWQRPDVRGKFLYVGEEKFWVRGVTYGAFRPNARGHEYHNLEVVDGDFALMAASGFNAVRIPHTMPPASLLDLAQKHGLRVMVGLSAEQYVGFLIDKKGAPDIGKLVRAKVRACAAHPALLCYAIGNEVSAPIARWLGRRRLEQYLKCLYRVIKDEDPEGLVSYVNYPTTEYLHLPFLDLVCFNVYLETQARMVAYLARLHNIADDRPLIMSEVGLDSLRNGEDMQARVLDWQIRTTFAAGCIGAFIFSWTDEWYRGGADVDDWAFGLTDQNRHPKPALTSVSKAFADGPFSDDHPWPRISVVVCSYDGASTIRRCLEGLQKLEYPNFEVIVVNDGSTDDTAAIVQEYDVGLISTENRGLGRARNTGLEAATGEIVAYLDDDAYPDPHWLTYLAATFLTTSHVGVGGPNLAPPGDGPIADCVANAPGGPAYVLLSDQEAEHIPGCNMAFRRAALQEIGGFDPQFRTAGDDVDVCWRLQHHGWTLGVSPTAMVWHHRRNSVRAFWKQQLGYGRAEDLLERKWPQKYNGAGHYTWSGRVYGKGLPYVLGQVARIYHGTWGSAPFQGLYQFSPPTLLSLLQMPEWFLILATLGVLSAIGVLWSPMLFVLPLLAFAIGASLVQASLSATRASFTSLPRTRVSRLKLYMLTACLHLLQPLARLCGRLHSGLHFGRLTRLKGLALPWPRRFAIWTENWQDPIERLRHLESELQTMGAAVLRGGDYDRWDLEVGGGILGAARLLMAVEDHGSGTQFIRFRLYPKCWSGGLGLILLFACLAIWASYDTAQTASIILSIIAALLGFRTLQECASATAAIRRALQQAGLEKAS